MRALVIPVEGPLREVEIPDEDALDLLQELVGGGNIEAVPMTPAVGDAQHVSTCYVNEEGKFRDLGANMRATDFMVPGVGILWGDHIAGPLLLCGFDPATGEHAELPESVVRRARLIEREAR